MAKQKKKRTKRYSGADAAQARPTITRVEAVSRNRLHQWWFDRKRILRPLLIALVVVVIIIVLFIELIRIIT